MRYRQCMLVFVLAALFSGTALTAQHAVVTISGAAASRRIDAGKGMQKTDRLPASGRLTLVVRCGAGTNCARIALVDSLAGEAREDVWMRSGTVPSTDGRGSTPPTPDVTLPPLLPGLLPGLGINGEDANG